MANQDHRRHVSERTAAFPLRHNEPVIRGLGVYTRDSARAIPDVRTWEPPVDAQVEPRLRELVDECAQDHGAFVWIGLYEPTQPELALVESTFDLPHLQVEDAANSRQRPKLEVTGTDRAFLLVKTLDYADQSSDVTTGQLAIFVGPHYVVTVRFGQVGDLRDVRARVDASPSLRHYGPISVMYSVLDMVVDGYLSVADEIVIDIEQVESDVFSDNQAAQTASGIYRLKRENVEIRRAVAPLVSTAHDFAGQHLDWIPAELRPYFQDIGEHLLRASDTVEASDNLLMTLLMASTSRQDLQQNRDMRKISAWVAMAAVPTMIAGIYGMNFDSMPELHQAWGYPVILGVMAAACLVMYRAFKRSGWL